MTTNLFIIELRPGRARRRVDLYDYENLLILGKERTDTSSTSLSPTLACVSDSGRLDFPGSSWCTHTRTKSAQLDLVTEQQTFTASEPGGLVSWLPKAKGSSSGFCSSRVDV